MGNNSGVIFGTVRDVTASGTVDLNWIQQNGSAAALSVGGDGNLTTYTPRANVAASGRYVLPFFWQSYQNPGPTASALCMKWNADNTYIPDNRHGLVRPCADLKKMFNLVAPDAFSSDPGDGTRLFWTFWQLAAPELKALDIVVRFLSSGGLLSIEQTSICCNIDF